MICSPCNDCSNKMMPKDRCLEKCDILSKIQEFQLKLKEEIMTYAIDYAEEINTVSAAKGYL